MKNLAGRPLLKFFAISRILFLVLLLNFTISGCLNEGSGSEDTTQVVADPEDVVSPPPLTSPERTVCDPFDVGSSAQDRGLVGNLLYLTDDQPRYSKVQDYIDNGVPIQSTLYFDRLFVPTRAFDLGFYTQDGTLILNQNDEPIYEYFALRLESQLTLAESEAEGWYQLAVLSDDGSMLYQKNNDGSLKNRVSNDGNHPTKMGCASEAIYLDHNSKIPIVLAYHQGPRFHIALSVLWRPLAAGEDPLSPAIDIECGKQGNSRFFDSTKVPSQPSTVYYEMLTRGWKPLNNENYYFPVQASNPCAVEDPLLITNFNIVSTTRTSVSVNWTTSLPSSSQIEIKNISTGVVTLSPLNNTLVSAHSMTFTGLTANTLYSVKARSETPSGQVSQSSESAFRTPR